MNEISHQHSAAVIPLPTHGKGVVVPFEKPQSALQKAVQIRAQETTQRQLTKPRIDPVRVVITLAVAVIPVLLLMGVLDGAVRAIHLLTSLRGSSPAAEAPQQQPPAALEQQPGVVFVVPSQAPVQSAPGNVPAASVPQEGG